MSLPRVTLSNRLAVPQLFMRAAATSTPQPSSHDVYVRPVAGLAPYPAALALQPPAAMRAEATDAPSPPLHRAIEDNQLLELSRLLSSGADIHTVNAQGMTPLHLAAKFEDTAVMGELLRRGARMDLRNDRGHTPLQTALVYGSQGCALLLTHEMLRQPIAVQPWPQPAAVARAFSALAPGTTLDADALDKLTKSFNHGEPDLNAYADLFKYYTHLGSVTGRFGGLAAEGWNFLPLLWQRARSLCTLIAQPFPAPQPPAFTEAQIRGVLTDELVGCLRSLHIAEVCNAAAWCGPEVHTAATRVLGREIVAQALELPVGDEITVPFGTTTHAIYAGLRPINVQGVPALQCRIDNLGSGFRRSHTQDKTSGKVTALTFNLPLSTLRDAACFDAFSELIATLLQDMDDSRTTVKMIYARVLGFAQQVQGDASILEVRDINAPHFAQWAGNCALKNHSAAVGAHFAYAAATKLGDGASQEEVMSLSTSMLRWFKDCERHLIIARIQDAVVPTKMWQHYADEAVLRLGDLVGDREARSNGRLERFFEKPNRETLAKKLTATQLGDVVRVGDVAAMQLLLAHGADVTNSNPLPQSTLLHQAVRCGNPAMVTLLLEHGADPKALDAQARTSGALARELGNGAALAALILHNGSGSNVLNEATLLAQLAMMQEALCRLHAPTAELPDTTLHDVPANAMQPLAPTVVVMNKTGAEAPDVEMTDAE